ncbi:serine hydrolase [Formosa sediminum]|uniref:Serine hydrolase n=1 Tax=Formosa sediminum TaxID=2594004 RepID=A0A516GT99_9FLAO|nr:serine hydrolase [Formosa sediminum]QDO94610.1 serine hydrolase [Formosa sediminum]
MKKTYLILLFALYSIGIFAQSTQPDYTEAIKLVEVWLEAQKDFDKLPGISAAIITDQDMLWSGAYGQLNVEKKVKTKATTICSICSISKLFTSVAIMKLYDEGKLRLDDRIEDLLPAYKLKQKYPESGPITIRSLLTHSSGLPREAAYPYWTSPDFPFPSKAEIDSKLENQETLYPASTYFQYSNLGLTLLGEIVEEITGIPYNEYIENNILNPLNLKDTRTELPEQLYGEELAIGYASIQRNGSREKLKFFQANGITPAAGFSSNVIDLGKFASWQFRLRDTTSTELLKPSTLKYMQNVHWTDPNWKRTWGLGFAVYKGDNGSTWVGHGGSCPGYETTLQLDLKHKKAYSVMINANGTDPSKYVKGMHGIIEKVKKSTKKTPAKTTKILQQYTGYYNLSPWWSEIYISTWNDKLVALSLPSDKPQNSMAFYKHIKGDTFQRLRDDNELGETLTFIRNKSGEIISFERHGNYSKKILK